MGPKMYHSFYEAPCTPKVALPQTTGGARKKTKNYNIMPTQLRFQVVQWIHIQGLCLIIDLAS